MTARRFFCRILFMATLWVSGTALAQIEAPANVTMYTDGSAVTLNWNAVPNAAEYYIYKDTNPRVDFGFPYTTTTDTSFSEPVGSNQAYYAVKAVFPASCFYGVVTDTNGVVMGGVHLYGVDQGNPNNTFCISTLANGTFISCDIPDGTYDVSVYAVSHPVLDYSVTIGGGSPTELNVQYSPFAWVGKIGTIGTETWTNNNVYQLTGVVTVSAGNTLTIEEGTTIIGCFPNLGLLIVSDNADIQAVGNPCMPIVFTSNRPVGQRANGDWGGIVLNGHSFNNRGRVPNGEGDSGPFGCDGAAVPCDSMDNSGIMQYCRLEFPGYRFTETNELNGLCLQGVGAGTTIDHIQVVQGQDDCVEFFGGTVSVNHMVLTDGGDDGFDWTDGWRGTAHHVLIHQRANASDRGIEADNLEQNNNALPRAHAWLSNFTIIGKKGNTATDGDYAITLRRGTEANLYNFIVTTSKLAGLDIDDASTSQNAGPGGVWDPSRLSMDYSIFWNNGSVDFNSDGQFDGHFYVENSEWDNVNCLPLATYPVESITMAAPTGWTQDASNFRGCGFVGNNATNRTVNPLLNDPAGYPLFNARPAAGSLAFTGAALSLPAGLPVVPYVGAFASDNPADDWTAGWTAFPAN